MPLEEIKKDIESNARSEAERIKKEADSEAKRLVKDAEEKAKSMVSDAETSAGMEKDRLKREHDASIEIESHNLALEAMAEAVDNELKSVKKEIAKKIESEHMRGIVKMAIARFAESVPVRDTILVTRKSNAALVESLKPNCDVKYGDVDGVSLRSKDGRITMDLSSEGIVDSYEDEIKGIMLKTMFGEEKVPSKKAVARRPKKAGSKKKKVK